MPSKFEPKIVRKKLSDVNFAPYNPRIITPQEKARLAKSLEEFGYADLIVYNKQTGNVVGGNQRLAVFRENGIAELDMVELDLSLAQEKSLNLALNKIRGDWDITKLSDLLLDLDIKDAVLGGFSEDEFAKLTDAVPITKVTEPLKLDADLGLTQFTAKDNYPQANASIVKNFNYFVVEYYTDEPLFKEVQAILTELGAYMPPHNIEPLKLAEALRNARPKK